MIQIPVIQLRIKCSYSASPKPSNISVQLVQDNVSLPIMQLLMERLLVATASAGGGCDHLEEINLGQALYFLARSVNMASMSTTLNLPSAPLCGLI